MPPAALESPPAREAEQLIDELSARLFPSLSRAGHRLKGEQYLRGLLTTPGRKSVRNIARALGDPGAAQRLHHFVSNAPWQWQPVREALAAHLTALAPPRCWVVRTLLIPKSGDKSVGVQRRFVPETGQTANGQQAHGLWYARDGFDTPVDWCLGPPGGQAVDLGPGHRPVTAMLRTGTLPAAPVLWDVPARDATDPVRTLGRLPGVVRLLGGTPLRTLGSGVIIAAERLAAGARHHEPAPGLRGALAHATLPTLRTPNPLTLYARWPQDRPARAEYWLTNLPHPRPAELHRLTTLAAQVSRAAARTGIRAGLRDFEGRSYAGWHRHMTLASAAYAALTLGDGT